ncbi:hypothetical protein [Nostoc sp.]|uniref:hypothetical protein n=1 Tax=Nostoc sp. TaxID=1180 RepID=UPI002FF09F5E
MTVKELLDEINKYPSKALVVVEDSRGQEFSISFLAPVDCKMLIKIKSHKDEEGI